MSLAAVSNSLLSASALASSVEALAAAILPDLRAYLGATGVALLRTEPPKWLFVHGSGLSDSAELVDAAAEALDREGVFTGGEWTAGALGDGFVLVAQRAVNTGTFAELTRAVGNAVAILDAREQRERRIGLLERVLTISHAWQERKTVESLLKEMAEAATDLFEADRATIFLWDRPNKQLVGRPALGLEGSELRIPDDWGIVGQVIRTGEPRRAGGGVGEDQIDRHVDKKTGYTTRSLLCVPLVTPNGKCLGAFEVINKRRGQFTDDDERGLVEIAAYSAVRLHNTQRFEELVAKHQRLVEQAAQGVQLVGDSPVIQAVRSTVGRIADTDLAILILGENGTGKEVVARSIHFLSRRRDQPFIAVNCAALAETLLESELFGHEKGAFTDAHEARAGKFELASGGTLFLDEIGEMSLAGQAKLLRVLEDKTIVRVGGSAPVYTDVRVLAATNQSLSAMVRARRFREDLFYRLNVVSLKLPPLRERGEDVLRLADYFLQDFCRTMGRQSPRFTPAAKKRLLAHTWPGNVRELRNLCERLAYLTAGDQIEAADLALIDHGPAEEGVRMGLDQSLNDATRSFQQEYVRRMIEATRGNMTGAAKRLGLHRSNLYRKMRQLDMETGDEGAGEDEQA